MTLLPLADQLRLEAHPHPILAAERRYSGQPVPGFPPRHPYVEELWTGVVGPTGIAALRRLAAAVEHGTPTVVSTRALAAGLGVGWVGVNCPLAKALQRLHDFRLACWTEPGQQLVVFTEVPAVPNRKLQQLGHWAVAVHDAHVAALTCPRIESRQPYEPGALFRALGASRGNGGLGR